MSVPGLMAPLEYDGRKLVDGGLVDNLPIQEVRDLCGAEVVIAVNVGSPLLQANEISGLISISTQMVSILTEQNVTQSLSRLTADDVYIKPDLTGISATQFERSGEAADRGRAAAQSATALAGLSVDPQTYAAWRERWTRKIQTHPTIDAIEITGLRTINPSAVERYLEQRTGESLDVVQLNRNLLRAYGDGYYERVDYTLTRERDRNLLRITPIEKAWGPDYVRLGINLNSTLTGRSTFSLRGAYQKTWLNPLGGEFLASAELGSNTGLSAELYQPLDAAQHYFVDAAASVRRENFALWDDDLRISDYRNSIGRLDLTMGLNVGMTGQLRLGLRNERQTVAIETGLPVLPTDPLHVRGWLASWETDQKNQLHIATTGWSGKGSWFESTDRNYNLLNLNLDGSYQLSNWVLGMRGSYAGSTHGGLPVQQMGRLGGFLNLSGFATDQLMGDRVSYGHLRVERILGRMPLGLSGDMRLGLALEIGKVADPMNEPRRTGLLNSTVVYVRGETPFGPAYMGLGQSSSGPVNAYLFIGTP
jgi:NTE family protein